ncbi:hypothetical protein HOP50_07g49400 [Chloropicon primus]|uniref:Zinc finger PHD-type domain-containing protein n=1 Tax=Chloropicon primus TaxID=1764295 RepID=A0A5B8MPY4_9CHLO|nr:hypothetical protein A3770_07p49190 [Chloropicon primus]UPR01618.1 hypothetical protein HOP50_07g49400 [Chloropicon primus]|mmetsp:Transcript_6492/g.19197  ORF Transcript_6492/g.19197 Transcript_6492/m.19197 type:complete len:683 (-) Transcript_6492:149-2197(-)|eukprot:QDZ22401.1 hypothetical protein A3770_07p49190 [Chloropicon primus]
MELRTRNEKGQVGPSSSSSFGVLDHDSGSEASEGCHRGSRKRERETSRQHHHHSGSGMKRVRYNLRTPFEAVHASKPAASVVLHRRNSSLDSDRSYVVLEKAPTTTTELESRCKRVLRSNSSGAAQRTVSSKPAGRRGRPRLAAAAADKPRVVVTAQELLELRPFENRVVEVRDGEGMILMTGVVRAGGLIECQEGRKRKHMRYTNFEEHAFSGRKDRETCAYSRGQMIYFSNGQTLRDFVLAMNSRFVENFAIEDLHRFTGATMAPGEADKSSSEYGDSTKSTLAKATMRFCHLSPSVPGSQFRVKGGAKSHKKGGCGVAEPLAYCRAARCSFSCGRKQQEEGERLLTCDACPQGFHPKCITEFVGAKTLRNGQVVRQSHLDFLCPSCKAQERFDPDTQVGKELSKRCEVLLAELDRITGGCCLCHIPDFHRGETCTPNTAIMCDQCEREFHVGCLKKKNMCSLKAIPKGDWFCSRKCKGVNQALAKIRQLGCHKVKSVGGKEGRTNVYTCEVLCGEGKGARTRNSLREALAILQESFDPLPHAVTGADLLPIMAKAQTCADHDYTTVHTILLRSNGEAVCACVIRICGEFLAELPFVATKSSCRSRGHCRQMFSVIENLLSDLRVRRYCLPAAAGQAMNTWIKHFGFRPMLDSDFRMAKADFRILQFPGTTVLVKEVSAG